MAEAAKQRAKLPWVALLPAAALLWWWLASPNDYAAHVRVHVVAKQRVEKKLLQRGILDAVDTEHAVVGVHGVIKSIVKQGSPIKAGEPIFEMDVAEELEKLEGDLIELRRLRLELERKENDLAFETYAGERKRERVEADLAHARFVEEHELARPDARDRRLMEIEEEVARLDLEDAEDKFDRNKRLLEKGFLAESALEPFERRRENARLHLEEILIKHSLRKKGITEERRVELRMATQRAEANLARYQNQLERKLRRVSQGIESTRLRLKRTERRTRMAEENIAKAVTVAKTDGVVRVRKYRDWRRGFGALQEYQPGVEKWPQDVIAEVIDPSRMKIKFVVHEADILGVHSDLPVRVRVAAFPGQVFEGQLSQVGAIGKDRDEIDPLGSGSGDSDIVMYNAEVRFESEGVAFRPGMSALLEIVIEPEAERVVIPREAVSRDAEGRWQVWTESALGPSAKVIEGEPFNEQWFLLQAGLEVGESILIGYVEGGEGSS